MTTRTIDVAARDRQDIDSITRLASGLTIAAVYDNDRVSLYWQRQQDGRYCCSGGIPASLDHIVDTYGVSGIVVEGEK